MASDSFLDVVRRVQLHVPDAPLLLIEDWVRDAYRDFSASHVWSFQRKDAALRFRGSRTISATFTQYSPTVTSAGLFVPTDAGRQIRVTSTPVYTIAAYIDPNTVTLERDYEDTGLTTVSTVLDLYPAMPLDFGHFLNVTNPYELRTIPWWISTDYLDKIDPTRILTGSLLRVLAARKISTVASTLGQYLYEAWPSITTARSYPYLYKMNPGTITESTIFNGTLGQYATSVLKAGALLACTRWPGTSDKPNAYRRDARLRLEVQAEWDHLVQSLWLQDDAAFPMQVEQANFRNQPPYALSFPTELLRETDATVSDYL